MGTKKWKDEEFGMLEMVRAYRIALGDSRITKDDERMDRLKYSYERFFDGGLYGNDFANFRNDLHIKDVRVSRFEHLYREMRVVRKKRYEGKDKGAWKPVLRRHEYKNLGEKFITSINGEGRLYPMGIVVMGQLLKETSNVRFAVTKEGRAKAEWMSKSRDLEHRKAQYIVKVRDINEMRPERTRDKRGKLPEPVDPRIGCENFDEDCSDEPDCCESCICDSRNMEKEEE